MHVKTHSKKRIKTANTICLERIIIRGTVPLCDHTEMLWDLARPRPDDFFFLDRWLAPLSEGPVGRAALRGEWLFKDGKKQRLLLEAETAMHVGGMGPDYTAQGWANVSEPGDH